MRQTGMTDRHQDGVGKGGCCVAEWVKVLTIKWEKGAPRRAQVGSQGGE